MGSASLPICLIGGCTDIRSCSGEKRFGVSAGLAASLRVSDQGEPPAPHRVEAVSVVKHPAKAEHLDHEHGTGVGTYGAGRVSVPNSEGTIGRGAVPTCPPEPATGRATG